MSKIIEYFKKLTQIPHCSKESAKLCDFLVNFAQERGYIVEVDEAKNIYVHKGMPRLCLQAHYDMVCMGRAPVIEAYIEEGWMKAKNSSLGADNGIAIAMMMQMIDDGRVLEFLFTSDEEIGLIGANELAFNLKADYMLNLDSEDEAEVYIGCAGGTDIVALKQDNYIEGKGICYEVAVKGLAGGHSGVDIDKNIPSAIKVIGRYLKEKEVKQLVSIHAGERRNSIPANAVAIVRSEVPLRDEGKVTVKVLSESPDILQNGEKIIDLIDTFRHGVHRMNQEFSIPDVSINFAIIVVDKKGNITAEVSARAMDMVSLNTLTSNTAEIFKAYGFEIKIEDKYPAWKPDITNFTNLIDEKMREVFGKSKLMAIHAGLECGVISTKYPQIKFASIGPTIRYPHSTREMVNIDSVEKIFEVLNRVIQSIQTI
ncbi:MAG: M20/M25/M40 family metallo-hydrolase [Sulfurovum sp.]|nr:M20/M25/M40 family metallo-hydrolase [Sulfurovum sp.]MCB4744387.1 M20/M25/M40 family metallo-hydrolase [Sulfurovum sp.]MCB4746499.1 M20/M25/M40 family metallo-hydrolase [Sulfurovum sp.]MCB4749410.1 M20/M25/M40 family metallo-hydrolase [Sulfurovum sp.]MCB4750483.1 M20/M25/M40 family metallo-hydrolase [Sulfurovum sp.]